MSARMNDTPRMGSETLSRLLATTGSKGVSARGLILLTLLATSGRESLCHAMSEAEAQRCIDFLESLPESR